MAYEPRHMKWWGWGNEDAKFHPQAHPAFWPYAKQELGIERDDFGSREWKIEAVQLPEISRDERFLAKLRSFLKPNQISDHRHERVIHAYGKGFRDLFRLRRGLAMGAPDLVVYPENERELCLTLRTAAERDV